MPGCDVKQRSRILSPLVGSRTICSKKKSWANSINGSQNRPGKYDSVKLLVCQSIPGQLKSPPSKSTESGNRCFIWPTQEARSSQIDTGDCGGQ